MITAGFSEVEITPELGLPMAGLIDGAKAEGVRWPLFARAAVFDDGERRVAFVSLDLLWLLPSTVAELRQAMTAGTDLAPEDIMIACTHTHRAPYTSAFYREAPNFAYLDLLRARLVPAMAQALAARRPARLKVGHVQAPGWTFNRRAMYPGGEVGTHGPMWTDGFARNEGPEDNELKVLAAYGDDGRIRGGLVNFACHTTVIHDPIYSADYPGPLVEALSRRHGGVFGFLQGATGNLSPYDTRAAEGFMRESGPEHARRMGEALAEKVDEALATGYWLTDVRAQAARRLLRIPQRRATREVVKLAQWYLENAPKDIDQDEFTRRMTGHDHTFYSNTPKVNEWFCREAIGMWEWQRRVGTRELIEDVEIQAIAVGDVAFVGYPAEYFTELGLETKAASPFRETFVVELANGWHGYVPTREAFSHGGYETRLEMRPKTLVASSWWGDESS